jgi:acyl-CoA thioesterase-1
MNDEKAMARMDRIRGQLRRDERLVIAGLGDSLTYGWMVRHGFFDRFVDGLEERFPGVDVARINAGQPGDTARGGLSRIEAVLRRAPQVVTVQFALNDAFAGFQPDEFGASIRDIARAVLDAAAVPVLATSCPLVVPGEQRLADRFYDSIRAVGRELEVPVADLERYWLDARDPSRPHDELFQADGVHPTDEGHQLMAEGMLALFTSPPP